MSDVMSSGGNDFGDRLRQAREYVGLSQEE